QLVYKSESSRSRLSLWVPVGLPVMAGGGEPLPFFIPQTFFGVCPAALPALLPASLSRLLDPSPKVLLPPLPAHEGGVCHTGFYTCLLLRRAVRDKLCYNRSDH